MKVFSSETLAALDAGVFTTRTLVAVDLAAETFACWDDVYDATIESVTYAGLAGGFTVSPSQSGSDMAARSVDITFSGLDTTIAAEMESQPYHQRPISISRALFSTTTQALLALDPWFTGFIDESVRTETLNGRSNILFRCEGIGRELGRSGARTRSEADQRQIDSADGFFKHQVAATTLSLPWGRATTQPPAQRSGLFGRLFG